jgi:hypothetical protein
MNPREQHYQPNRLLDTLIKQLNLVGDAELAKTLYVKESVIRHIRKRSLPISGFLLLHMSEVTGIGINALRDLMGDRRSRFRIGYKVNRQLRKS